VTYEPALERFLEYGHAQIIDGARVKERRIRNETPLNAADAYELSGQWDTDREEWDDIEEATRKDYE